MSYTSSQTLNIQTFIQQLQEEFEDAEPNSITPETDFRGIKEWSSMHALILIALIDLQYKVTLTGEDLRNLNTVGDVFKIIQERSA